MWHYLLATKTWDRVPEKQHSSLSLVLPLPALLSKISVLSVHTWLVIAAWLVISPTKDMSFHKKNISKHFEIICQIKINWDYIQSWRACVEWWHLVTTRKGKLSKLKVGERDRKWLICNHFHTLLISISLLLKTWSLCRLSDICSQLMRFPLTYHRPQAQIY